MLPLISFAQKEKKQSQRKQGKAEAVKDIQQLKKTVLLVRLSARKNSINAMRKVGKEKMALKTERKQRERNLLIIEAFKKEFTFCEVYFFYSEDSDFIRKHQLDSVSFLSEKLLIDKAIEFKNTSFYTAELGTVNSDAENSSGNLSISALIIKDDQLVQLNQYFPYYIREFKGLPFQRAIFKMVKQMDNKLFEFYNESK